MNKNTVQNEKLQKSHDGTTGMYGYPTPKTSNVQSICFSVLAQKPSRISCVDVFLGRVLRSSRWINPLWSITENSQN